MILALDTSTPATTVAVGHDGAVLAQATVVDARRHAEVLTPLIVETLVAAEVDPHDLTHVVVGVGPGPYTGLRVGVVTALAWGDALSIPSLGVVSHDALLAGCPGSVPDDLLVATDARRQEVFWSRYVSGERVAGPFVDRPSVLADRWPGLRVVGEGARRYTELLGEPMLPLLPSGAALARLAMDRLLAGAAFEQPRAVYLRRPDAVERAVAPAAAPVVP
ncbi:MAG: tRNA (adenosine(37)-N6)-threonylcarbamoyltransferase complex dimerization subunit type 1 TsaB [Actinomycetes bacterium]